MVAAVCQQHAAGSFHARVGGSQRGDPRNHLIGIVGVQELRGGAADDIVRVPSQGGDHGGRHPCEASVLTDSDHQVGRILGQDSEIGFPLLGELPCLDLPIDRTPGPDPPQWFPAGAAHRIDVDREPAESAVHVHQAHTAGRVRAVGEQLLRGRHHAPVVGMHQVQQGHAHQLFWLPSGGAGDRR